MNLSTWRSPSRLSRPDAEPGAEIAPFGYLQDNVNRLFGQFFRTWPDTAIASRDTCGRTTSTSLSRVTCPA